MLETGALELVEDELGKADEELEVAEEEVVEEDALKEEEDGEEKAG